MGVALVLLFLGLTLSGSLADPSPKGFVTFDEIRRSTFTAIAVQREFSDVPQPGVLVVRVNVVGDAADAEYGEARAWLAEKVNVRLVEDRRGVPLYLTRENLIATSGPVALGATIKSGMAVEMRDDALSPCVLAHEVLHFLGLHHVDEKENLLYPRCAAHKLAESTLAPWQLAHVASLERVSAVTSTGFQTWAYRAS